MDEFFDLADPDLWKSNSFASLKPRLIIHVEAAIAKYENERVQRRTERLPRRPSRFSDAQWAAYKAARSELPPEDQVKLDRAKAIYRKLTGVEWTLKPSEWSQTMASLKQQGRL